MDSPPHRSPYRDEKFKSHSLVSFRMNNRCSSSLSHRIGLSSGNTTSIVVVSSPPCLCAGSCLPTTRRRVTWIGDLNFDMLGGSLWTSMDDENMYPKQKKHWVVGDYNYTIERDFVLFLAFFQKVFEVFTQRKHNTREMKSAVKFHIFFFFLPFYQFFSLVSLTMVIMTMVLLASNGIIFDENLLD